MSTPREHYERAEMLAMKGYEDLHNLQFTRAERFFEASRTFSQLAVTGIRLAFAEQSQSLL